MQRGEIEASRTRTKTHRRHKKTRAPPPSSSQELHSRVQRGEMPQLPAEVLQQGGMLQPGGMTLQWQEGALPPGGQAAAELGGCGVVQGWGVAL